MAVHRSAPTTISTPCVKAICSLAIGWSDLRAGSHSWMHGGRSPHVRSGRPPIVGPRGRGSLPRLPAVNDGVRRSRPVAAVILPAIAAAPAIATAPAVAASRGAVSPQADLAISEVAAPYLYPR